MNSTTHLRPTLTIRAEDGIRFYLNKWRYFILEFFIRIYIL